MANYVKNIVKMEGIASLPLYSEDSSGHKEFDFDKIIPMPESLDMESGSKRADICIVYFLTNRLSLTLDELDSYKTSLVNALVHNMFVPDWAKDIYGMAHRCVQKTVSRRQKDQMYQDGERYVKNYLEYGAATWYEWRNREWGTKWNASDTEIIGNDAVVFYTG